MNNVMIDIETLGNGENKCVIQVGACYFDRDTGEIGATFKKNIDAGSAIKAGLEMDAATVYWWLAQSDEARASILADPKEDITAVFHALNLFLEPAKQIWSHATFDFVTLMETYRKLGIKPLFGFRTARDIRTLMDIVHITVDRKRDGVHHDALADALHQVKYCMEAFDRLRELKAAADLIGSVRAKIAKENK